MHYEYQENNTIQGEDTDELVFLGSDKINESLKQCTTMIKNRFS